METRPAIEMHRIQHCIFPGVSANAYFIRHLTKKLFQNSKGHPETQF